MFKLTKTLKTILVVTLLKSLSLNANIEVSNIFNDNMVLQRDMPIRVWGWGDIGERVTVSFKNQTLKTEVKEDGTWEVKLAPIRASKEESILRVSGKNSFSFKDVLVGDIWFSSGQSNMAWSSKLCDAKEYALKESNKNIKLCKIENYRSPDKQNNLPQRAKWSSATAESALEFSAISYIFAKELNEKLDTPIAIILSAVGGTNIESWMSEESLISSDAFQIEVEKIRYARKRYTKEVEERIGDLEVWIESSKEALKEEKTPPAMPKIPHHNLLEHNEPISLYNSMVYPIHKFAIKGFLWYQGESNTHEPKRYGAKFTTMIRDWRAKWDLGELPFYYVLLAPHNTYYKNRDLTQLWQAQESALTLPNSDYVSTLDIGDWSNIHPYSKVAVGKRLSKLALKKSYGKDIIESNGPRFKSAKVDGNRVTISFENINTGLTTKDGKNVNHLEIAGSDKKFVKAKGEIRGDKLIVSAPSILEPIFVRYAWRNAYKNKEQTKHSNIINGDGFSAFPFSKEVR
jgi:sialate O-acetylesterase